MISPRLRLLLLFVAIAIPAAIALVWAMPAEQSQAAAAPAADARNQARSPPRNPPGGGGGAPAREKTEVAPAQSGPATDTAARGSQQPVANEKSGISQISQGRDDRNPPATDTQAPRNLTQKDGGILDELGRGSNAQPAAPAVTAEVQKPAGKAERQPPLTREESQRRPTGENANGEAPGRSVWPLLLLLAAIAGLGGWQYLGTAGARQRMDRLAEAQDAHNRELKILGKEVDALRKRLTELAAQSTAQRSDAGRPPPNRAERPPQPPAHGSPPRTGVPYGDAQAHRSGHGTAGRDADHDAAFFAAPGSSAQAAPVQAQRPREPALKDFLVELQDAAGTVLADTGAASSAELTAQILNHVSAGAAAKLRNERLSVGAHSAATDLSADFGNPHFISVIRLDGEGWLLPHRRAGYAYFFHKYFIGEGRNWPSFSSAAVCRVNSHGTASVLEKGEL